LFLLGLWINVHHDGLLVAFKEKSKVKGDSKGGYLIPTGGLFNYISCANYFGEILEWTAFALITLEYPQVVFTRWI